MSNILISVIVPIYNMEKYLSCCIDSILAQSYSNLEIILVNDGSKDSSLVICEAYAQKDKRIKIIDKPNGGSSSARNAGLDIADGDYISFVDSDDWIEPNMYEILANTVESIKQYGSEIIRFNAYRNQEILNPSVLNGEYSGDKLINEVILPTIGSKEFGGTFIMGVPWLNLYKRDYIEKYNFRYILDNRLEDRLFTVSVFMNAKSIYFINDVLYHYIVNENSLTNSYNQKQWQLELDYIKGLDHECRKSDYYSDEMKLRFNNDVLLRSVMNIHYEFFSNNPNNFIYKHKKIKQIINDPYVLEAAKHAKKKILSTKNAFILFCIKHRLSLLLSTFEMFTLFINKIKK